MFTYSLQGLELTADVSGPLEVEENETTARSAVYQVLGAFFAASPADAADGERWSKELAEAATLLPFAFEVGGVAVPNGTSPDDYAAEHDRLLGASALLGGAARDDRDAEIASVRREYEYFGLASSDEAPRPADHLATELDFLQYLCFREAATPSPRLVASFRRAQRDFLVNHVLDWVPGFVAATLAAGAGQPLAWALERLDAFLTADHDYVVARLGA
ncbi:MAG: molecular chaperone TorD family protein [Actinomycetota bacterium]|jgi:hypothetical protein|nr:molecular chaperone TorD family protein [Actinomycetota bacterium]